MLYQHNLLVRRLNSLSSTCLYSIEEENHTLNEPDSLNQHVINSCLQIIDVGHACRILVQSKQAAWTQAVHIYHENSVPPSSAVTPSVVPESTHSHFIMVLKLYGSAMSTARVLVIILELDLPYEHIPIDFAKGEQHTDGYKQLQPFGKVPVLVDEGFVMFESRAICRYLVRYRSRFLPLPIILSVLMFRLCVS